jgi:hypothetical protein
MRRKHERTYDGCGQLMVRVLNSVVLLSCRRVVFLGWELSRSATCSSVAAALPSHRSPPEAAVVHQQRLPSPPATTVRCPLHQPIAPPPTCFPTSPLFFPTKDPYLALVVPRNRAAEVDEQREAAVLLLSPSSNP